VEVKASPRSKIQPSQQAFLDRAHAAHCPTFLIDDLDDVETFFPLATYPKDLDSESGPNHAPGDLPLGGTA
jgi:hypothetical protein